MKYKINKLSKCPELLDLCTILSEKINNHGNDLAGVDENSNFVLNLIDLNSPRAFNRKSQEEKVVSITLIREIIPELKSACYTALIKSISNILFCIYMPKDKKNLKAYSITPEVGFTEFEYNPDVMYHYMYPVISSHFVLRNRLSEDLLINGNQSIPEADDIIIFGKELGALGALPAPFPLSKFLNQDLIDQLFRLYRIRGLSYGNLSIRNFSHKVDGTSFWMTARGVDKSNLRGIGKDILLVKGYDEKYGEMLVSVPHDYEPGLRVSVDAIEHYWIYREFPEVGAIVHVHAWIDGVLCTTQSFPCGTIELAENVVELFKQSSIPQRTEVGLKNHGLTITGPDIRDIFQRIRGRLSINVPMFS
jgi:hypothetical protein